jgi:hypothetical protein
MEFIVDPTNPTRPRLTIKNDRAVAIFDNELDFDYNNATGWLIRFDDFQRRQRNDLDNLLAGIPQLLTIASLSTDQEIAIYQNLLEGALLWLTDKRKAIRTNTPFQWQPQYDALTHQLFLFSVVRPAGQDNYEASFSRCGGRNDVLGLTIPRTNFEAEPTPVSLVALHTAYQNPQNQSGIFRVLLNYKYFSLSMDSITDAETRELFLHLSKALIVFIEKGSYEISLYASVIPEICAAIVKNETDLEEQQLYLQKLLQSRKDEAQKKESLQNILDTLRTHLDANPQVTDQQRGQRIVEIIRIISDHYLQFYDLETSAQFWDQARNNNFIFKFFLHLHRHPFYFVLSMVLMLTTLFVFALNHWAMPTRWPSFTSLENGSESGELVQYIPVLLLGLFFISIFLLLGLIIFNILLRREQWLMYAQLPLPRIIGASIVGLFPLLLNDQSWFIGIQSSWMTYFFLLLFTYLLSFIYSVIEVSKTIKFAKGRSRGDALNMSWRLFWIATFETLIIITVTSAPVFSSVKTGLNGLTPNLCISINLQPMVTLDFFPLLIVLWSGVALFIGSFVQLLWQGERLTEGL